MKRSQVSGCVAVVLGGALSIALIGDAGAATSGVIHFFGAIVEAPCAVNVQHQQINTQCIRGGQVSQRSDDLNGIATRAQPLPASLGTSQLNWVDTTKKQAVVTVSYF
jgi:type 1 fimbria pilin